MAAHPHVCGEHRVETSNADGNDGSSPRVWGALQRHSGFLGKVRLIPTCVGSTPRYPTLSGWRPAHPHVCGEHLRLLTPGLVWGGSSPRVWGALGSRVLYQGVFRLIPTCVGSTSTPSVGV